MKLSLDQLHLLAVLGGLLTLFVVGLWLPHRMMSLEFEGRIQAAQEQLETRRTQASGQLTLLDREVDRLESELVNGERYLAKPNEWPAVHKQITEVLADQQVTAAEINTRPSEEGESFSILPVTLRFEADFPAVFRVIKQIESNPRLLRLTRVDVEGDLESPERQKTRLEVAMFYASETDAR